MDRSSNSIPSEAVVSHLEWIASVDFDARVINGKATYTVKKVQSDATKIRLDTSELRIHRIHGKDGSPLTYVLSPENPEKPHLGQMLEIALAPGKNDSQQITIVYRTTPQSTALQWLPPSQTAGKKYPYLFSQCQAIHARALLPCQDACGVKFTYKARVSVPKWATCVMSALEESMESSDDCKTYSWNQPLPISSYLLAIAVGELSKKVMSPRCAIWSEPSLVEAAADEFADTEEFLKIAEDIAGSKYAWGRYDLLCLPPSFPFGGMENPCLTFVTPTLLAGDRSLADVVAHEIAHSWTGNLVTCATWDHFWLNEGWTMWLQRKIMARIKNNPQFLDFDAIEGRKHLHDAMVELEPRHTKLVLDIGDEDPDESYSSVAYEKGFTFVLYLERLLGTPELEKFFQVYLKNFAPNTLTSDDFKDFFLKYCEGKSDKVKEIDWDTWFHKEGMPPVLPELDQSMAKDSRDMALLWWQVDREGKSPPATNELASWSSLQICCFLDDLELKAENKPLRLSTLTAMNELYNFAASRNSEILFRYCGMAIAAEDKSVLPIATRVITTQGRMKFTRPLYRALYKSWMGRKLAVSTFLEHRDFYHPICSKMVAQDLNIGSAGAGATVANPWLWMGVAAIGAGVAIIVARSRK